MRDFEFDVEGKHCNISLLTNAEANEIFYEITGMVALFSTAQTWPKYSEFRALAGTLFKGLIVDGVEVKGDAIDDVFRPPAGLYTALFEAIKGNFPELSEMLKGKLQTLLASDLAGLGS